MSEPNQALKDEIIALLAEKAKRMFAIVDHFSAAYGKKNVEAAIMSLLIEEKIEWHSAVELRLATRA